MVEAGMSRLELWMNFGILFLEARYPSSDSSHYYACVYIFSPYQDDQAMTYPHVLHLNWARIVGIGHPLGQNEGGFGPPNWSGGAAMHASLCIIIPNVSAHGASSPWAKR